MHYYLKWCGVDMRVWQFIISNMHIPALILMFVLPLCGIETYFLYNINNESHTILLVIDSLLAVGIGLFSLLLLNAICNVMIYSIHNFEWFDTVMLKIFWWTVYFKFSNINDSTFQGMINWLKEKKCEYELIQHKDLVLINDKDIALQFKLIWSGDQSVDTGEE